jgi:hypothetical protein
VTRGFCWFFAGLTLWAFAQTGCSRPVNPEAEEALSAAAEKAAEKIYATRGLDLEENAGDSNAPSLGNQWAVIIGINQYPAAAKQWSPLQFAVNDAREVRDMLRDEDLRPSESATWKMARPRVQVSP